jgi:hypothetical protein
MGRELTVPQVLEPGARVLSRDTGKSHVVLGHDGRWWGVSDLGYRFDDAPLALHFTVIAPAPREGQLWSLDGDTPIPLKAAAGKALDSLAIAKSFLALDFDYAGPADAAPETLRASDALTVEPMPAAAPPAPWTLTSARRLITETTASAKPRRPDAFTAALCALAEHGVPPAKVITETAAAFSALEAALPEHGAVARWQAERAMWAAKDGLKGKLNGTQTIIALAAATLYLQRRGAW